MKVTYLDHMGTDLTVANAARVSFKNQSNWIEEIEEFELCGYGVMVDYKTLRLSERDQGLIKFLARKEHWSPFAHPQIQVHVKAPIFVARQLAKHQVGLVWNEVSGRYVEFGHEFFRPDNWRAADPNVKQGSKQDEFITDSPWIGPYSSTPCTPPKVLDEVVRTCTEAYHSLLQAGVCKEQARMVLPLNLYTEWYWTGSLLAFSRVYNLRSAPDAQAETRVIAGQLDEIIRPLFPASWDALTNV